MDEEYSDEQLAQRLQEEEYANEEVANFLPEQFRTPTKSRGAKNASQPISVVGSEWEELDPTPDLQALFLQFNDRFFWGRLSMCEVKWSPRMTSCAGVCSYQGKYGLCSIRLSVPLLKLRPRADLVETLLHEMIHAFLFVSVKNDDHDAHGPQFHEHMYRINKDAGTNITVYHTFHDEVASYQQHWWRCNGICKNLPPYYGYVKRAMNRAPSKNDRWWPDHQTNCGGTYAKIREPEDYGNKGKRKAANETADGERLGKGQRDIRSFISGRGQKLGSASTSSPSSKSGGSFGNAAIAAGSSGGSFGNAAIAAGSSSGALGPNDIHRDISHINSSVNTVHDTTTNNSRNSNIRGMNVVQDKCGSGSDARKNSDVTGDAGKGNMFGFGGSSFALPGAGGGVRTTGRTGTFVVRPGRNTSDNSSAGELIRSGRDVTAESTCASAGHASPARASSAAAAPRLDDVRQNVRAAWASRFDEQARPPPPPPLQQVKTNVDPAAAAAAAGAAAAAAPAVPAAAVSERPTQPSKSTTFPCPVCNQHVQEKRINGHLDNNCLGSTPTVDLTKDGQSNREKCFICSKEVHTDELAYHINCCLDAND